MSKTAAIEKMKNEAEAIASDALQQSAVQQDINDVHLAFGAIGGMRLVSKFIGTSMIKVLQQVRDRKQYKSLGFATFEEFLEDSPLAQQYAGISYKTFNNLENQMLAEGEGLYELLNRFSIPISTRQLLAKTEKNQIELDGDNLIIGAETYDLNLDAAHVNIKEAIKDLARETKQLVAKAADSDKQISTLKEQIETGTAEFQELQRAVDAQATGTRYEQALTKAVGALINLTLAAKDAPIVEKDARGRTDIETLWKQMLLVRTALYQDDFAFVDDTAVNEPKTKKGIAKTVMQELPDIGDDFGDELEG